MARGGRSRLASSSEVTAQQEPGKQQEGVEGDGVGDLEARPFPKVGDVVRYEGKWESDVSFGEVRQYTQQSSGPGFGTLVSLCRSIGLIDATAAQASYTAVVTLPRGVTSCTTAVLLLCNGSSSRSLCRGLMFVEKFLACGPRLQYRT